jgi:acyl-CoA synthetase (NDP forming)
MQDGITMDVDWEKLASVGIPVPRFVRTESADDAAAFFGSLGGTGVVVKAQTSLHKSAAGLVRTNIGDQHTLRAAITQVGQRARDLGVSAKLLVQEAIPPGPEAFIGLIRDPAFGPVVAVGIGGRLVEAIGRRALRFAPVTPSAAASAVAEVGLTSLALPSAVGALTDMMVAIGDLAVAEPSIAELDLNPVILGPRGACAVDLRVVTSPPAPSSLAADRPVDRQRLLSTRAAVHRLIEPRSVAVIGASASESKPGGRVLKLLARDAPQVQRYPVNPRGGTIDGDPVYASIEALPDGIDVAVLATPAKTLTGALEAIGDRAIPTAVAFASGFREIGEGDAEDAVRAAAAAASVRLCGVNTMGIVGDAPLTFTQAMDLESIKGDVSFLTQSGAIGGSLLIGAWRQRLGTARFISVGNETDLTLADYLDYLAHDPSTATVGIFLEGVDDGAAFRQAVRETRRQGRNVVALHAGTSPAGAASVQSHTGAMTGSAEVYRQAFVEDGVIPVSDIPELLGVCQALSWQPRARGRRVAVLSTSGGGCSLVADHLSSLGLEVPPLDDDTLTAVRSALPGFAATRNPIDTTGNISSDPSLLQRIIDPVLASAEIDSAFVAVSALVGRSADRIAGAIIDAAQRTDKPIIVAWMVPESAVAAACDRLRAAKVPVFTSIRAGCAALSALTPPGSGHAQRPAQ